MQKNFSIFKKIKNHEVVVKRFYYERSKKKISNLKKIGWGSKKNQYKRFFLLTKNLKLERSKILDFGCGYADLINFLKRKKIKFEYFGYDINNEFIKCNKKKFKNTYFLKNFNKIYNLNPDHIVCSGLFTYKTINAKVYNKHIFKILFSVCKKSLSLNFLSKKNKIKLDKNIYFSLKEIRKNFKTFKCKKIFYYDKNLKEITVNLIK